MLRLGPYATAIAYENRPKHPECFSTLAVLWYFNRHFCEKKLINTGYGMETAEN